MNDIELMTNPIIPIILFLLFIIAIIEKIKDVINEIMANNIATRTDCLDIKKKNPKIDNMLEISAIIPKLILIDDLLVIANLLLLK